MNGELAQMAALTAHAKVALASSDSSAFLTEANSTFKFVHDVTFELETRRFLRASEITTIGTSPIDWYRYLVNSGVRHIDLALWSARDQLPDHMLAGFSGGGCWGIRTESIRMTSLWIGRWEPDHRELPNNRIWSVRYREFPGRDRPAPRTTIEDASDELRAQLQEAERLAREGNLSEWADWFQAALQKMTASAVVFKYNPDMMPAAGYTQQARRLLAACEEAWVFGGMGSWNDAPFQQPDLERRYKKITPRLYSAVLTGIAAAVNSFEGTRSG